jgi:D-aspartate ligase
MRHVTNHPPTPQLPVLIFGTHITALAVLRVLHSRGIESYVVDATKDIIMRSRWYRPAERLLAETSDSDELAEYLRSLTLPHAVLIACSDRWTSALAGLPADVRERFPASVPPLEAVEQFVDKFRFRDLVEGLGIPHPDTIALGDLADLERATAEELAAGFLKPTKSHLFHLEFGTKGFFVTSREEAASLVERASAAGITLMLQEWIPGGPSRSYLIDGFVDLHGNLTTILARRRVRMDPPRIANTASHVTVPLAEVAEAPAMIRMLLEKVHYRGIFNVEVKFDVRDGRFKIIEVNPRPFWHIGHVERAGVDLPWMAYLDAQGLPVTAPAPYRTGRYGLYEISDAAAVLRAWGSFRRPNGPVLGPWLWGDHTLLWWGDLGPGAVDLRRAVRRRVGNALKRLRGAPR